MATYVTPAPDNKYFHIAPGKGTFTLSEIEKYVGRDFEQIVLLSDDIIIAIRDNHLEEYGFNDLASTLTRRKIYGPILKVEPIELDDAQGELVCN